MSRWSSPAAAFLDPRGPDASDGRAAFEDAGYIQVRVDRRARCREALLLDHEGRDQTALVAHDAGAQVPVDDEAADARDLVALEDDGDVALREDEEPVCLWHPYAIDAIVENVPELPPRQTRLLAHAEAQMVQAVADPTTATKRHARALLLGG